MKIRFLNQVGILTGVMALAAGMWAVGVRPAQAITLVPPSLEYSVKPGQVVDSKLKIYNEGAEPLTVYTQTAEFTARDEEGSPDFTLTAKPTGAAAWIEITKDGITLAPNERREVPIVIRVPADAEPGGHYATVFFGNTPSAPTQGGQIAIQSLVGTLVILRVEGQILEQASIVEYAAQGANRRAQIPVTFLLRIQNSGNVHFRPKGFVTIRNMFGGVTKTIAINPREGAVLPNSIRRFEITWDRETAGTPKGFFGTLRSQWQNFALGTYTAEAVVTYGQDSKTLTGTDKVTILPWTLVLVILVGIALIIFLLVWFIRRYNAMIIRRAQKSASKSGPSTPTAP